MKSFYVSLLIIISLSFLVGCSKDDITSPTNSAYNNASASKGGIMFDKFWSLESGFDQTNTNIAKFNAAADFFRCKQCHGWDLKGNTGAYINRKAKTSRPNVSGLNLYQIGQTKTSQELFDAMKKATGRRDISYDLTTYDPATNNATGDQMPNFSQILTDAQIWDLVKFLKEGAFDVEQLYDATTTGTYPTGTFSIANVGRDGNAASGKTYFAAQCAMCHGAEGKTIPVEAMSVGQFTRKKANEVQHKVKYGALGSSMSGHFDISLSQTKDLYKALADTTAFPDL